MPDNPNQSTSTSQRRTGLEAGLINKLPLLERSLDRLLAKWEVDGFRPNEKETYGFYCMLQKRVSLVRKEIRARQQDLLLDINSRARLDSLAEKEWDFIHTLLLWMFEINGLMDKDEGELLVIISDSESDSDLSELISDSESGSDLSELKSDDEELKGSDEEMLDGEE